MRDGTVLPERGYTRGATLAGRPLTGLVDGRTAVEEFRKGATVVFQGLHRSFPPLVDLISELELELGHPCQANAYLTPPGSQGFAVHADTHDVFVLQTAGTKQWELHAPPGHPEQGDEEPLLEPGHVMYLPTGTPHAARAQDTVSLHITIGINQLTWRGLVERSLSSLAAEVPSDHLPAGYLDGPAGAGPPAGPAPLRHRRPAALGRPDRRDRRRRYAASSPRGRRGSRARWSTGSASTRSTTTPCCVAARATRACWSTRATGSRCCSATGPSTCRPGSARRSSRSVDRRELRPRDLPLDEQSRLVLARQAGPGGAAQGRHPDDGDVKLPLRRRERGARRSRWPGRRRRSAPSCWSSTPGPGGSGRAAGRPDAAGHRPRAARARAAATRTKVLLIRRPAGASQATRRASGSSRRTPTTPSPGSRPPSSTTCTSVHDLDLEALAAGRSLGARPRTTEPGARGLHPRPARHLLRRAGPAGRGRSGRGVPGRDVGGVAHRRRPVRREPPGAAARPLLRPARARHRARGGPAAGGRRARPRPPPRPLRAGRPRSRPPRPRCAATSTSAASRRCGSSPGAVESGRTDARRSTSPAGATP